MTVAVALIVALPVLAALAGVAIVARSASAPIDSLEHR